MNSWRTNNTEYYEEVVDWAWNYMVEYDETPYNTIKYLVDSLGVELDVAQRATEQARLQLRRFRGY